MKSATMPTLRVTPETRHDAENLLEEGETLSSFLEQSLIRNIHFRKAQKEFIARGLVSKSKSRKSKEYFSKSESLSALDSILERCKPT